MTSNRVSSEATSRLLEEIQKDLPEVDRPFAELASRCGIGEAEAISILNTQCEDKIIRDISAIIDGRRIGFRSTLAAVKVPDNLVESTARRISAHPGVSHNYLRNHTYNIWFTIAVPSDRAVADEVEELVRPGTELSYLLLPSIKTYKLRVHLSMGANEVKRENPQSVPPDRHKSRSVLLSSNERKLLAALEQPFPLTPSPWKSIGDEIGETQEWVLKMIRYLKDSGVIRRIAGVLRHRKVGYTANGMTCFAVPLELIDEAGLKAAGSPSVSHCYHREVGGAWRYPLFAMIHAKSRNECRETARIIAADIGCDDYQVLFSTREFKKERVKYFGGAM